MNQKTRSLAEMDAWSFAEIDRKLQSAGQLREYGSNVQASLQKPDQPVKNADNDKRNRNQRPKISD